VAGLLTVGPSGTASTGGGWLIDRTPQSTTGTLIYPNQAQYDSPVTADVTLSDLFQASAPDYPSLKPPVSYRSPVLSGKIIGVVDFVWVKSVGASSLITNLSSASAKLLLGGTLTEDKLFSGGKSTVHVYAFGQDEDSGTRIAALADIGSPPNPKTVWPKDSNGNFAFVRQYQPTFVGYDTIGSIALWPATAIDGINYPAGDPGFSGDGALAYALSRTNGVANTEYIGYLGINDATNVGTSNWLKFDGMPPFLFHLTATGIASAIQIDEYPFWGYEHFLFRGANFPVSEQLTGNALTVATRIQNQILNRDASVSGMLISSMHFHRNSDGGVILRGGTPPNVP
jgi:hypothetical protein